MAYPKTCLHCRHFRPFEEGQQANFGECRRFPPQMFMVEGEPVAMFTQAAQDEFCGEWAPHTDTK